MTDLITVGLVDDDPIVLSAVASYLSSDPGIVVAATASDGSEAGALAARYAVDVLVMDIRMPDVDGITATALVRRASPRTKILLLTSIDGDDEVRRGLEAGASGFLLKDTTPTALVEAVRSVHLGTSVVSPGPLHRILSAQRTPATGIPLQGRLSPREREILVLLGRGATNAEISDALGVAESTVKTHVSSLMMKLSATSRMKAVARAFELGLLDLP